jgi:hypothetical protein
VSVSRVERTPFQRILISLLILVLAALTVDIVSLLGINESDGGPQGAATFEMLAAVPVVLLVGAVVRDEHRGETRPLFGALAAIVLAAALVWAWLWFLPRLAGF